MELTSELIMSDSVVGWTPNLNGAQPTTGRPRHWRADSRVGDGRREPGTRERRGEFGFGPSSSRSHF